MDSSLNGFLQNLISIDFERLVRYCIDSKSTIAIEGAESLKNQMIASLNDSQVILGAVTIRSKTAKELEKRIAKSLNRIEQIPFDKLLSSSAFSGFDRVNLLSSGFFDINSKQVKKSFLDFFENPKNDPLYFLKKEIDSIVNELAEYNRRTKSVIIQDGGNTGISSIQKQRLLLSSSTDGGIVTHDKSSVLQNKISQMLVRIENIESGNGKIIKPELIDMRDRLMELGEGIPNGSEDLIQEALSRVNALLSGEYSVQTDVIFTDISVPTSSQVAMPENPNCITISAYLNRLLNSLRDVSSTYGNTSIEKISEGDGSFRRYALSPLLRGVIMLIKSQKIDMYNFSWAECIEKFDFDSDKRYWQVLRNVVSNYRSKGDFSHNLILLPQLIDEFAETEGVPLQVLKYELNKFLIQTPFRYSKNVVSL